jgi:F0F1-type ATP synthase assembly protein I
MVPPFRQLPDEQQHLTGRQRRLLIVAGVIVLLIGIATAVWTVRQSAADRSAGCVSVNVPSTLGGAYFHYCGTQAQQWCAAEYTAHDTLAVRAHGACDAAGYGPRH